MLTSLVERFPFLTSSVRDLIEIAPMSATSSPSCDGEARKFGIVFCGRQAPGAHNAVVGLLDYAEKRHPGSEVVGFVGGTAGLFAKNHVVLSRDLVSKYADCFGLVWFGQSGERGGVHGGGGVSCCVGADSHLTSPSSVAAPHVFYVLCRYVNMGGMDMLGRTADKIRSADERAAARAACIDLGIDVLVLLGGPFTHTDAAYLCEEMLAAGESTRVVAVPASVDFDLKVDLIEASVGFDTACKVYSQLIGNIMTGPFRPGQRERQRKAGGGLPLLPCCRDIVLLWLTLRCIGPTLCDCVV